MPHLVLQQKDAQPVIFTLTNPVTTLGRSSANDIFLTDQSVSREHAKIVAIEHGGFEIHDLGAKHPTVVNGVVISHHRLQNGDRIRLGDSILIFRTGETHTTTHVEFLAAGDMAQESVEVASLDATKTDVFSTDEMNLSSLKKDHQRLMLLYEFGKAINQHLEDSYQMLDEILSAAFKSLDADRGFIALADEDTGDLNCELVRDTTGEEVPEKHEVSSTILHKVLKEGISLLTVNALKDS